MHGTESLFTLPKFQSLGYGSRGMMDVDEMLKLRKKCPHFRVLIIGRANAGKTTLLQKISHTGEEAMIQDPKGNMIPLSTVLPSHMRGMHDVEKELVFPSNPGFVFHDSRGIEAGGTEELDIVRNFIAKRAKAKKLKDRIHVIWYCIPVDSDRMFTAAEKSFFDNYSDGIAMVAPVIAVFTKFDHRDIGAFTLLQQEGLDFEEAKEKMGERAKQEFEKDYLPMVYERKYPPKRHVYLRDLDKPEASIAELAERTTEVVEGVLVLAFVSTQRASIAPCAMYALEHSVDYSIDFLEYARQVLMWFPYDLYSAVSRSSGDGSEDPRLWRFARSLTAHLEAVGIKEKLKELAEKGREGAKSYTFAVALCIVAEYSFCFPPEDSLRRAIEAYLGSSLPKAVDKTVNRILKNATSNTELTAALLKATVDHSLLRVDI